MAFFSSFFDEKFSKIRHFQAVFGKKCNLRWSQTIQYFSSLKEHVKLVSQLRWLAHIIKTRFGDLKNVNFFSTDRFWNNYLHFNFGMTWISFSNG